MNRFTTVIADDEKSACDRLERLLKSVPEIDFIGSFTSSAKAADFIIKQQPDLAFLDVEMDNNVSAFDIINDLHENACRTMVILVTAYQQYSIKAIRNEVFDYLLKPVDVDELKASISRLLSYTRIDSEHIVSELSMLSNREKEILRLVLDGYNSREISEKLFLSVNTVSTHRRNILKKSGCRSTLELLRIKS